MCRAGSSKQRSRGREIAVVVILVGEVGIGGELIPGVGHIARRRAIPHGVIREALSRP